MDTICWRTVRLCSRNFMLSVKYSLYENYEFVTCVDLTKINRDSCAIFRNQFSIIIIHSFATDWYQYRGYSDSKRAIENSSSLSVRFEKRVLYSGTAMNHLI